MIFNVLSLLGACYVFLTVVEFIYSLIYKIPTLLERNVDQARSKAKRMDDEVFTDEKSTYQSEIRKRRRRIAAGEIRGYKGRRGSTEEYATNWDGPARSMSSDTICSDRGEQTNRTPIKLNRQTSNSSTSKVTSDGVERSRAEIVDASSMVGYYDTSNGGTVTAVRGVAPKLSFEVEHHNRRHLQQLQLQSEQHLQQQQRSTSSKVDFLPIGSHLDSKVTLDTAKLMTVNSTSSASAGGVSPFKISENSAFRPVQRTPSLDRDIRVSEIVAAEPAKITIVMRNNLIGNATVSKETVQQTIQQTEQSPTSFQRTAFVNGRKESLSSISPASSAMTSNDSLITPYLQKQPMPSINVVDHQSSHVKKRTVAHDGSNSNIANVIVERVSLKSTPEVLAFHDFNKTAECYNSEKSDLSNFRRKKEVFSGESQTFNKLDNYSPLATSRVFNDKFGQVNNNNIGEKFEFDELEQQRNSNTFSYGLARQQGLTLKPANHTNKIVPDGGSQNFRVHVPDSPVRMSHRERNSGKSFEETLFQAMQPSPTLFYRPIKNTTTVIENVEVVPPKIIVDKSKPSENLARWQAEKLEYKKFRNRASSDNQYDVVYNEDLIGEQALFQTEDILKAGNVTAKAKLFETIAEHEKLDVDTRSSYRRQPTGRRKTERAQTMLLPCPRTLAPELFMETPSMMSDSGLTASSVRNVQFDSNQYYHQRSPSPLSSDHEDEKSKMTMIEKAKLFEAKDENVKVPSSRSKVEDRRKTQPVTQDELAKARTVLIRRIGNQMTDNSENFKSNETLNPTAANIAVISAMPSSNVRLPNMDTVSNTVQHSPIKKTMAVKPRKTVRLHTDDLGTVGDAGSFAVDRSSFEQYEEHLMKNGNKYNSVGHLTNGFAKKSPKKEILREKRTFHPIVKNGSDKSCTNSENSDSSRSDNVFIDDDSFAHIVNTRTDLLTSFSRAKPKRRHSMHFKNNFNKLRESEL